MDLVAWSGRQNFGLLGLELCLGEHAAISELAQLGHLIGGSGRGGGDVLYTTAAGLLVSGCISPSAILHFPAAEDQMEESAQERQRIAEISLC
jgi:hypothetical protein